VDILVMRSGCFCDMNGNRNCFSPADLARTAAVYDAAQHQAPLVLGHPTDPKAPAFGWVTGLLSGPAGLVATIERVDEAFKDAVRAGRYRNVSASFWPPSHAENPHPGAWYLRHVGALGGVPPAVRGLGTLAFSEPCEFAACDCGAVEFAAFAPLSRYERARAMANTTGCDLPTVMHYLRGQ
jgi:hypothetical protein